MGHSLDKCVSKISDDVIKGPAAAGEPSSKPQNWSGQWRLPYNACCFIGCCKAVLMSPQRQSFSKFGSYSKYISSSSTSINRNCTVIFWYIVVCAFTHMCDKNQSCMIVKNSAIGIFSQIMVRALVYGPPLRKKVNFRPLFRLHIDFRPPFSARIDLESVGPGGLPNSLKSKWLSVWVWEHTRLWYLKMFAIIVICCFVYYYSQIITVIGTPWGRGEVLQKMFSNANIILFNNLKYSETSLERPGMSH